MGFKSSVAVLLALGTVACSSPTNPVAPTAVAPTALMASGGPSAAPVASVSAAVDSIIAGLRNATARYHDVDEAIADGYAAPNAANCVEVPGLGAMGVHSVNAGLVANQTIDSEHPEVLLYLPMKGGGFRLVGVEFLVPLSGPTDPLPRPSVFGQSFQGPMAGHEPGAPWHYDLHVWAWAPNPNGTFAQFNPRLSCEAAD